MNNNNNKINCLHLYSKSRQCIKRQRHHFANKGPNSQSYGFFGSHLWMWELDYKEGWVPKNWCFQTVVLEKTLENPTRNQCWIFTGRTETEASIFWSPDAKSWLIGKDWWWERWKAEGEEGDREWDRWMVSLIQWTWTWENSGIW